jgi:hypothetical protein
MLDMTTPRVQISIDFQFLQPREGIGENHGPQCCEADPRYRRLGVRSRSGGRTVCRGIRHQHHAFGERRFPLDEVGDHGVGGVRIPQLAQQPNTRIRKTDDRYRLRRNGIFQPGEKLSGIKSHD